MLKKGLSAAAGLLAALCLAGCTAYKTLEEAAQSGAVLGQNIVIDGVDISGLTLAEAESVLEAAHRQRLREREFIITAGEDSVALTGAAIPIKYEVSEALLAAANLPVRGAGEGRTLHGSEYYSMEELRAALAPAAMRLEREAVSAVAEFDKAACKFSYTPEVEGRTVDVVELASMVAQNLAGGRYAAKISAVAPAYTQEQAEQDTQLIAEFSTSFEGSTYGKKNRVANIAKAAGLISGVTVQPGEEFDMNAVLGDRTAKNGWQEATAIRDGAYTQEYGGGVCQVSTTLYNAVLMADLKVTERHHHSWPLGYVDIGRDATISTGGPNFRFQNTGQSAITIGAVADEEAKLITVRIYGRRSSEWHHIELSSEKVESIEDPGDRLELDSTLPPGTRVEQRKSRPGSVAQTYKSYFDLQGNLLKKELVSQDKYRPIEGIIYVSEDLYYSAAMAVG